MYTLKCLSIISVYHPWKSSWQLSNYAFRFRPIPCFSPKNASKHIGIREAKSEKQSEREEEKEWYRSDDGNQTLNNKRWNKKGKPLPGSNRTPTDYCIFLLFSCVVFHDMKSISFIYLFIMAMFLIMIGSIRPSPAQLIVVCLCMNVYKPF